MENDGFSSFLMTVDDADREFAAALDAFFQEKGCKREMKTAKSGYTVSYIPVLSGKTLAVFVCRKTGVKLRIYPHRLEEYEDFLDTLPQGMKKDIRKASVCKRLLDPKECNPKCARGYDFHMDGEHFLKCRHMAFMPSLCKENNDFIKKFLDFELG